MNLNLKGIDLVGLRGVGRLGRKQVFREMGGKDLAFEVLGFVAHFYRLLQLAAFVTHCFKKFTGVCEVDFQSLFII